jgi:hypothetical protein
MVNRSIAPRERKEGRERAIFLLAQILFEVKNHETKP